MERTKPHARPVGCTLWGLLSLAGAAGIRRILPACSTRSASGGPASDAAADAAHCYLLRPARRSDTLCGCQSNEVGDADPQASPIAECSIASMPAGTVCCQKGF